MQRRSGYNSEYTNSRRRFLLFLFVCTVFTYYFTYLSWKWLTWTKPNDTIIFSKEEEAITARYWNDGCPKEGGGPLGVIITVVPGGRLGNLVFEYLSVWAAARRYNLFPAVPQVVLQTLYETAFTSLAIPSLEDVTKRCNLTHLMEDYKNIGDSGNRDKLFEAMEYENYKNVTIVVLSKYVIDRDFIIPYWLELNQKMQFQKKLITSSQDELHKIKEEMHQRIILDDDYYSDIQYVAVHVRRTDYIEYIKNRHPGAKAVESNFFMRAMEEMRQRLKPRKVIFVVVSDDPKWCRANLQGPDVIISGNGDINSPGHDLALLSTCNHTILAYGTFALTAALYNANGITIAYCPVQNITNAAMDFANKLPNWIIF